LVLVYILSLFGIVQPFEGRYALHLEETITTCIILLVTGALLWVVVNLIDRTAQQIIHSEFEAERAYDLTLEAWAQALELRQREVKGHSQRVTALTVALAERLGYDREALTQLRWGALLHDIGKMGITEKILHKPGPLSAEEWEAVTRHTRMGEEILRDIPALQEAKKVVCCHHERIDGQGYPLKLTGEEIPEGSRIFAVADSWDMLRSERPYSPAWTDEQTLAHLEKEAGRQFDARVVAALRDLLAGQSRERQEQ
jgi:putative nucleotidyltransferase with HDIG domain